MGEESHGSAEPFPVFGLIFFEEVVFASDKDDVKWWERNFGIVFVA